MSNMSNKPEKQNIYDFFLLAYITINGIATGNLIRLTKNIIKDETGDYTPIKLLLYLGLFVHTGTRIYDIYKNKQNNGRQR